MFIPCNRVSHSKGGSEGGREEGGGGGGEGGCFDFSNHSIPCPSVPYFKRTLLPHCEHILVCMCCIYIFSLLLLLLLFCHPFPSPPEASMAFSALFSLPTLFSLFLALTGVIFCDRVTQIGDNSASTIVCRPNCVWRTESARHTYNACLSLFFYGNLAISLAIQFQSVFLYA